MKKERTWSDIARDPETPPKKLLQAAEMCPAEVLANPGLPILLLEDPNGIGAKIMGTAKYAQAKSELFEFIHRKSTHAQRVRFAIRAAERVLPLLEKSPFQKADAELALEEARSALPALGTMEWAERKRIYEVFNQIRVQDHARDSEFKRAVNAAAFALHTAYGDGSTADRVAQDAAHAAAYAAAPYGTGAWDVALAREAWAQVELAAKIRGEG